MNYINLSALCVVITIVPGLTGSKMSASDPVSICVLIKGVNSNVSCGDVMYL